MRRKLLSILLCLVLCCGLLPVTAMADAWSFGSQLSGYARDLYNAMNDSPAVMQTLRTGQSFDLAFDGPFSDLNATGNALSSAITPAFGAL